MLAGFLSRRTPLLLALSFSPDASAGDLFVDTEVLPEVLTATRLKQSSAAVPGSMTVLDSDLIKASGARDIAELMRLVPGMMVGYTQGNQPMVNYHGSTTGEARRMQVLIDGRSVYRAGLATVDWNDIPVALEDIERIEVFRGPNTVSYGANALMGVINILTRTPSDTHGTRLKLTQGLRGSQDWYASQGQHWAGGDLRLSLSGQRDDGFDAPDDGDRDNRRLNRFALSVSHALNERHSLEWQLNAKEGTNQRPYTYEPVFGPTDQRGDNSDVQARDYAGSLRWTFDLNPAHSLYVQASAQHWDRHQVWRACDAAISFSPQLTRLWQLNPDYAEQLARHIDKGLPPGGTATEQALARQVLRQMQNGAGRTVCGDIDQSERESRYDLELQDTLSLNDNLRLVSGLNYRYDTATSQTYFNGRLDDTIWRLFGHLEWRASEHWLVQGGMMFENTGRTDASLTPRVAVNYLINPRQGFRAVYSEAVRSPNMFENNADWSYRVNNLSEPVFGQTAADYFVKTRGPGNLEQEHMRSRELGYNGYFVDNGLTIDLKLFHDEISQMITEPLRNNQYIASNSNSARFQGFEGQLDWRLSQHDRLRGTYAQVDASTRYPTDPALGASNSGSTGWLHEWGREWSSALFYYHTQDSTGYNARRADVRVAKRLRLGKARLELAGTLQQRLDDRAQVYPGSALRQPSQVYFSAELAL